MTSCNGPNYIDLLTNGWNDSVIHTQQQAVSGSPVAWSVIGGHEGKYTNDFVNQVDGYVAAFTEAEPPGWSAANSIYHADFGINDIYNSWQRSSKINPLIFHQYQEGFDKVCNFIAEALKSKTSF